MPDPQAPPPQPGNSSSAAGISLDSQRNVLLNAMVSALQSGLLVQAPANTLVGNNTGSPHQPVGLTPLQVFALLFPSKTVTATYSVAPGDFHIRADATAGAVTINLPAKSQLSQLLWIIKIDNVHTVTISSGDSTINGSSTLALAAQWKSALLICTDAQTWDAITN